MARTRNGAPTTHERRAALSVLITRIRDVVPGVAMCRIWPDVPLTLRVPP